MAIRKENLQRDVGNNWHFHSPGAHHESFSLMSTEGLAILFVGFILVAFVCLWIVKVSCLKSAKRKKTAKKMDESKEQLVV